jgi:hypothetical protein
MPAASVRKPLILAWGAKARQGKNEAVAAVESVAAQNGFSKVLVVGFADALKTFAQDYAGMVGKDAPLLQALGNHMRGLSADFWIKIVARRIESEKPDLVLIPDLRYLNEAEWVTSNDGICIEIVRLRSNGKRYIADDRDPNHVSETSLDGYPFSYTVTAQSGKPEELRRDVTELFGRIVAERYGQGEDDGA